MARLTLGGVLALFLAVSVGALVKEELGVAGVATILSSHSVRLSLRVQGTNYPYNVVTLYPVSYSLYAYCKFEVCNVAVGNEQRAVELLDIWHAFARTW